MGRVKDWIIGMEEDAMSMSRESWAEKHGAHNLSVFDEAREKYEDHVETAGKEAYGNVVMEDNHGDKN